MKLIQKFSIEMTLKDWIEIEKKLSETNIDNNIYNLLTTQIQYPKLSSIKVQDDSRTS